MSTTGLSKTEALAKSRADESAAQKAIRLDPVFPYVATPFPIALLKSMNLTPANPSQK